jgi:hypothetical protein
MMTLMEGQLMHLHSPSIPNQTRRLQTYLNDIGLMTGYMQHLVSQLWLAKGE